MVKETKSVSLWQTGAISIGCSVISAIVILGITKTDQAAPKDYVDKRFEAIQNKLDQKADKDDIVEIKSTLTTMDARLYDLWASSQPKSQKQ